MKDRFEMDADRSTDENMPMEELQELCVRAVGRHFQKIGLAPAPGEQMLSYALLCNLSRLS